MAIVSPRPQTTRTRITGIKHMDSAQVVFVDTPGLHHASGPLGQLMAKTAERALEDVDVICLVAEATGRPDRIDDEVLERLRSLRAPIYCCLNKVDLVTPKSQLLPLIEAYRARYPFAEIIPVSATRARTATASSMRSWRHCPSGRRTFPPTISPTSRRPSSWRR